MKRTLVSLAALAAATPALAGTIDYSNYSVTGDVLNIDTPVSAEANVGVFHLTTTKGTVDAWCVDVFDDMQGNGTYNVLTTNAWFSPTQIGQIGALVNHGAAVLKAGGNVNDEAAAIQMAIWNVAFDATFDSVRSGAASFYTTYLNDVTSGAWKPDYNVSFLSPVGYNQTLVTAGAPEPSTLAMVGLGFLGLAWAAYTRKRPLRYAT